MLSTQAYKPLTNDPIELSHIAAWWRKVGFRLASLEQESKPA